MNRIERVERSSGVSDRTVDDACADAVDRILMAVPEILDAMITKAKDGSQQHAKFLFDWAKLEPMFVAEQQKSATPSLAQLLLDKLREDTGEST